MAKAQIGLTGFGGWGILWKDFKYMENRGGYSGPFKTYAEAEERARQMMKDFEAEQPHEVVQIETVNP